MTDIDPKTGLPEELGAFDDIAKESQAITVRTEKRKFGKVYTLIEGLNENEIDMKSLSKKLKSKFACGGTVKDGVIELQGDHTRRIQDVLTDLGFAPESINVR
jgi:translation initiation factor 1